MNNATVDSAGPFVFLKGRLPFRLRHILPIAVAGALLLALLPAGPAQAQTPAVVKVPHNWSLIPSGLTEGDQFRLIFLSSTTRDASSTDIGVYNTWIQNLVASSGHTDLRRYSQHFRVVGSTSAVNARDNTNTNYTNADRGVPIYWVGGNKVADDYPDLYDGTWDDEANPRNERGGSRNTASVWTGSEDSGATSPNTSLGDSTPVGGVLSQPSINPLSGLASTSNTENRPLYGLSPVFEVKPPPSIDLTFGNQKGWSVDGGRAHDQWFDVNGAFDVTITFSEPVSGFDLHDVTVAYRHVDGLDQCPCPSVGLASLTEVTAGTEYRGRVDKLLDGRLAVWVEGGLPHGITANDGGELAVSREEDGVTVNTAILHFNVDAPSPSGPSPADAVWSSTMTVGDDGGYMGYSSNGGSLDGTPTFISGDGTDYTVEEVLVNPYSGRLFLRVSTALPSNGRDVTLNVGDRGFPLSDATVSGGGIQYTWVPYAPGWSEDDEVEVSLRSVGGL